MTYTAVTFAPVQSFIRASRKLRDLYGSSLLLSHLARAIAEDAGAHGHTVISPASISSSRGVPNVLVIEGDYRKGHASEALLASWKGVLEACRQWVEKALPDTQFEWQSSWKACGLHTWELFHGQGSTIELAREALAVTKQQRDWSVPNWTGESSTLSSAEAVVWPLMGQVKDPRQVSSGEISEKARAFLNELRLHPKLGEAFAGKKEEISLTELVKRLVTYPDVAAIAFGPGSGISVPTSELIPARIQLTSTRGEKGDVPESIVWFMADGDGVGDHLQSLALNKGEKEALQSFSQKMRNWAAGLYERVPAVMENQAMVVYAGGDDLFGALHETEPGAKDLSTDQLWRWLRQFPQIWQQCDQKNLTVSMGLVWADAQVPQREALQHARDAEASAKARGKNRFALRLLYANGNHLEWTCPWEWLDPILSHYTDREGRRGPGAKWRHLAEDLQWLQSRQAIAVQPTTAERSETLPKPQSLAPPRVPTTRKNKRKRPPPLPAVRALAPEKTQPKPLTDRTTESCLGTAKALWTAYFPGLDLPPRTSNEPMTSALDRIYRATAEKPEDGRRFDQWLLDLGRVMAGLEKHQPPCAKGDRP